MFRVTVRFRFIEPQLPSLVDQPPEGKHWIQEIKLDGYRSLVLVERESARVLTRNGFDWSDRYPSTVRAASNLRCKSESSMVRPLSRIGMAVLTLRRCAQRYEDNPKVIILYAFDLLHLDGKDLRQQTLSERRANLKHLIGTDAESRIQFSEEFGGDGASLFKACAERELEGIVSSPYG